MPILEDILFKLLEFLILPLIVIIFYDFITFLTFFGNLCDEIDENFKKSQSSQVEAELDGMRNKLNERILNSTDVWVGFGKTIIIWVFTQKTDTNPSYYYRYLPSNEFRNFVQRGYYHYVKEIAEQLTLFYFYCDRVSITTQDIESNNINHNSIFWGLPSNDQKNVLEIEIERIRFAFNYSRPTLENIYYQRGIHSFFNKNIFHIAKLYLFKTNKSVEEIMSRSSNSILIIVWLIFAVITALVIATTPLITFCYPHNLIKDMASICINVSSFALATILAICAIIAARPNSNINNLPIMLAFIPILGIFSGFLALSFSYFSDNFDFAKLLFALTIEFTIGNFLVFYLILNKQNLLKMLAS